MVLVLPVFFKILRFKITYMKQLKKKFVKDVHKFAEIGEVIYVEIKNIDTKSKKCILSIKDLDLLVFKTSPFNRTWVFLRIPLTGTN